MTAYFLFKLVDNETGQEIDRWKVSTNWDSLTWLPQSSNVRPGSFRIQFERVYEP